MCRVPCDVTLRLCVRQAKAASHCQTKIHLRWTAAAKVIVGPIEPILNFKLRNFSLHRTVWSLLKVTVQSRRARLT